MRRNKTKRWMTFQSIFAVVLITAFLIFIAVKIIKHLHEENIYKPIINPTPKHFITIEGTIDPRLKGSIVAIYETENKKCFVTTLLEVGPEPRTMRVEYQIKSKNHKYKLQLPIDTLLNHWCEWRLVGYYYEIDFNDLKDSAYLFNLNQKKTLYSQKYYANIRCQNFSFEKQKGLECQIDRNYDFSLPQNINDLIVNILFQGVKKP